MAHVRLGLCLACSFFTAAAAAAACGSFSGADSAADADAGADTAATDAPITPDGSKPSTGTDSGKPVSGTLTSMAKAAYAQGLFVNDNYVYYTTSDFGHPTTNEVSRISKKSGAIAKLATSEAAVQQLVTPDDDYVFWTTWGTTLRGVRSGSPGTAQTLIGSSVAWFAIGLTGASNVVAAEFGGRRFVLPPTFGSGLDGGPYGAVAQDLYATTDAGDGGDAGLVAPGSYSHFQSAGDQIFWTNETSNGTGGVYSAAPSGVITQWAADQANPWGLAVNDKYIVYTTFGVNGQNLGHVVRIDRATREAKVLADNLVRLAGVLISGTDVYFAEFVDGGSIWRVPLDGSLPKTAVAEGQHQPQALAEDADAIYFTLNDAVNGGVVRMQK